jgi:hypothetical protein
MRWIVTILLALATAAPAAAELDVPDFEKEIAKKERAASKLDRQDPAAAEVARQELEQLRLDAAAELARYGERALDEEYDLALAEKLLERGQDIALRDELAQLAMHIVDIREDVLHRHAQGALTYERLSAKGAAQDTDGWFELRKEYRDLVRWHEVDRGIKKLHDRSGKELFPRLLDRGDADMAAGNHRRAVELYEAADEIRPGAEGLPARLRTARDRCRADELAAEAEALLDTGGRAFGRAIELYDEALGLNEGHPPLLDGREIAVQRGVVVLLEDAARAHADSKDLEALQLVDRARALSTPHGPTHAATAEAEGVYRESLSRHLVIRGDEYAGYGNHAQAYVDYALAAAIHDGAGVDRRMDDALSHITEALPYTVVLEPPALGDANSWGDLAGAFSKALRPRIDEALDGPRYHVDMSSRGVDGADAVVSGEFRSFDVTLDCGEGNWCKAQLEASLEIGFHKAISGTSDRQLLMYSSTHEGYDDEPLEGVGAAGPERDPAEILPDDDACIREMIGALADQARDAILAHVHTHGDRWKVHFEQQHPNWQTAYGAEDLLLLLLSDPARSEAAADWAAEELLRRYGLRWSDRSADLEHIRPLTR